MSINRREELTLYVEGLLGGVEGIKGVFRDRAELPPDEKTPGIVLLDGRVVLKTDLSGRNFQSMPASVFTWLPQIFLVLTMRSDVGNTILPDGTVSPVGPEMSEFETKITNALLNDESLAAMLGDNGSVEYRGFDSDMQTGSTIGSLGATVQYHFAISYVLDPSDLI